VNAPWISSDFAEPAQPDDPRLDIRIGTAIAFLFFVVLLGWAAFAPLDAGVHAQGVIAVSGNRQSVQHREGGVVTALHVREGERVEAGEVLVEMAAPDLRANERALTSEYLNMLAQRARLTAEINRQSSFAPPAEFAGLTGEDRALAQQAMRLQQQQLSTRVASMSAQQSVIGQRSAQLGEQRSGFAEQRQSLRQQQELLRQEIAGMRELEKKGFASTNRLRALERALAELEGREAAMTAEIARAGEGIGETRMQSLSIHRTTQEEAAAQLRETQARISDVLPKLIAAREQLQRATVRAPASGQVVGLTVFTVGGVVQPGQTLMEIVPANKQLIVQAQVDPRDADDVYLGQEAQLRFLSVDDRTLPLLTGKVRTISADAFTDEASGQSYFRAEIEVEPSELDKVRDSIGNGQLRAGLPVEVVLAVRKRTALQYLIEPLTVYFWRALREQ
jgi:HlyD family type I secretion membrane fusion protein